MVKFLMDLSGLLDIRIRFMAEVYQGAVPASLVQISETNCRLDTLGNGALPRSWSAGNFFLGAVDYTGLNSPYPIEQAMGLRWVSIPNVCGSGVEVMRASLHSGPGLKKSSTRMWRARSLASFLHTHN
ncbi:MAG: hypothetical protein HYU36_01455 [Planctomycetes bacterium]|nr:hypothetical protein [Planctomycetota bacterium]